MVRRVSHGRAYGFPPSPGPAPPRWTSVDRLGLARCAAGCMVTQENRRLPVDQTIVFLHIPKTGGTSLHEILVENFRDEEICPERFNRLEHWNSDDLAQFRFFSGHFDRGGLDRIPQQKSVISIFRDPKRRILSLYYFWRSHKDAVIKRANLHGPRIAKQMPLLEFLRNRSDSVPQNIDNMLARTLLGKISIGRNGEYLCPKPEVLPRVTEYIERMAAFGIMEEFDESAQHILSTLGFPIPERIPHARNSESLNDPNLERIEREPVTPEIEAELERLTEMDQQIYEYARRRFRQLLSEKVQRRKAQTNETTTVDRTPARRATLTELADRFRSDKGLGVGAKPHRYTYLYDLLFWPYRQKPIKFLDIGFTPEGDPATRKIVSPSVEMWLAYFPRAHVFRFDVMDFSRFNGERFTSVQGDPGSEADLRRVAEAADAFDLVIDDGSHASYHQQQTLKLLLPKVARGGIYIIEDLHAQPSIESSLPAIPRTAFFLNSFFEREKYIDNPVLSADDMAAMKNRLASYASFPAFDGSASETKLVVLRGTS